MIDVYSVATANGQKVYITLEECGLAYNIKPLDLYKGEHKADEYRAINPFGKAPAIIDHDAPGGPVTLSETMAICWYLAEKTGSDLLPKTPLERANYMMWAAATTSSIAQPFSVGWTAQFMAPEPREWWVNRMDGIAREMMTAFDKRLAQHPYLLGDRYTLADVLFYPVAMTSAARLEGWLEPYPNVAAFTARLGEREAVKKGMAAHV
jgi:GST-like protein